jgi:hypothetical protein
MVMQIGQLDSKSIVIQSVLTVSRRGFIGVAQLQESGAGLLDQSTDAVASDVSSRL